MQEELAKTIIFLRNIERIEVWVDGSCLQSNDAHAFQCLGRCTVQLGPLEEDKDLKARDVLRAGQRRRSFFSEFASEIQAHDVSTDVADEVGRGGRGPSAAAAEFPSCRAFSYVAIITDSLPWATTRDIDSVRHCHEERWAILSGSSYDAATLFLSQQLRQVFWGGVAVLLSSRSWTGTRQTECFVQPSSEPAKGELFCFLPLGTSGAKEHFELLTATTLTVVNGILNGHTFAFCGQHPPGIVSGLPVHMNASFAVSSNRRNLWSTAAALDSENQSSNPKSMLALADGLAILKSRWNAAILHNLLPQLYAELLDRV